VQHDAGCIDDPAQYRADGLGGVIRAVLCDLDEVEVDGIPFKNPSSEASDNCAAGGTPNIRGDVG
jgi:hypothetical protein